MITECPHCHRKVLPAASGECPACSGNVADIAGTDPTITLVTVDDVEVLPPCCALCGKTASGTVALHVDRKDPDRTGAVAAQQLQLSYFGGIIGELFARFGLGLGRQRIHFNVPICDSCRRTSRRVEMRHVDFEQRRVTILASVEFKKQLDATRAARRIVA